MIERELKKITMIKLNESNYKIIKPRKNIHEKKILKNKALTKLSEVIKTRQ